MFDNLKFLDHVSHVIGCFKFYAEQFFEPPIQCRKCKSFGHIAAKCTLSHRCGFCSEEHDENDCKNKQNKQAFNLNDSSVLTATKMLVC